MTTQPPTVIPPHKVISIIIPTHNRFDTLQLTIKSVLRQIIPDNIDIEIMIIDDASTDGTKDKISLIAELVTVTNINNRENNSASKFKLEYSFMAEGPKGPSSCRNLGTQLCTGDYIIYLDSDDQFYDAYAIKELYGQIATNERMGVRESFVYGDTIMYTQVTSSVWEASHIFSLPRFSKKAHIESWGIIPMGSFIFTKKILKGKDPFNPEMQVGEDLEWQIRMAMKIPFVHIEKIVLSYYRNVNGQLVSKTNNQSTREKSHDILKKTMSIAIMGATQDDLQKDTWHVVPYFPKNNIKDFEEISKEIRTLYKHTLHKPIDLLIDGELIQQPNPPKDGVSILWIIPGMKLQSPQLYKIIENYSIILTFNCNYTERLKNTLRDTSAIKYVSTLNFPMVQKDNKFVRIHTPWSLNRVYLTCAHPQIEQDLEHHGISYTILDAILENNLDRQPGIIILSDSKFHNSRNYFRFLKFGLPVISIGRLGTGLIANNNQIYFRDPMAVAETVDLLMRPTATNTLRSICEGTFSNACTNPRFSVKEFCEKFDSIVRRAVIELSDWNLYHADKNEREGEKND